MHSRNPTHEELMWILLYADDISLVCDNIYHLRTAVSLMDSTFLQWGLTISTEKTKVLVVGRDAEAQMSDANITIRGDTLVVSGFKYLPMGSNFTSDGTLDAEIAYRIAMLVALLRVCDRSKYSRPRLYHYQQRCSFPVNCYVLLYGGGNSMWTMLDKHLGPLSTFQMNCFRRICGISGIAHVPNVG